LTAAQAPGNIGVGTTTAFCNPDGVPWRESAGGGWFVSLFAKEGAEGDEAGYYECWGFFTVSLALKGA